MKLKIKKTHPDAVIPQYMTEGAAGMDLTAVKADLTRDYIEYDTGLAFEIPEGYVGLIFPRSSISKKAMSLCNAVGVVDSDFTGNVTCRFRYTSSDPRVYVKGERMAQMLIVPVAKCEVEEVDELTPTARGEGAFGSTGK